MLSKVRVLIVDDSAVVRGLVCKSLQQDESIEVAGTAMHGEAALAWLKINQVDVIVLDVEMPVMDGLETLRNIQRDYPRVKVIMASSLTSSGAKITMQALSMGAAECIAKPVAKSAAEAMKIVTKELIPLVKGLGGLSPEPGVKCHTRKPLEIIPRIKVKRGEPTVRPKLVIIGASTGGPNALNKVLCDLGPDFDIPILIVQHMPPMFTGILAKHLQQDTGRTTIEGKHADYVQPGTTYVAPGGFHMKVLASSNGVMQIELNEQPEEHFCRPSVNPMFRSASKVAGKDILGVMLTGMGSDGLEGTREVVEAGGYMLAQDEPSSVVWGMPGAIAREDLPHEILPLDQLGSRIKKLCHIKAMC
ncbi:MAG: chemotaxis response regulator protein-glutamate methylesterase [Planctomycetaceae bacterium]|nr:chemotaxis response regulator protein-glutamate methylesterase [Planctomycetaceae bacterium]